LAQALSSLPAPSHHNLLVGINTADDAGVYRIADDLALVQTVDFFPPIVDDPYWFGQIAAANALSDIYAMGGRPVTALNIVGFPVGKIPDSVLTDILRGGQDKIIESGAVIVGGHSIKDSELKYGVAVTGLIHPERIITNAAARPGDQLFLTKPLGTGLITTGIKRGKVEPELEQLVIAHMARLNKDASELMLACGAHAATDITGYGLAGHAFEMAAGAGVTIRITAASLPLLPRARELAELGMIPGGANANRDFMTGRISVAASVDPNLDKVIYDPQTSGGLLIAIPADQGDTFLSACNSRSLPAVRIGDVLQNTGIPVDVV
jgi:selenide,water dikinase